MDNFDIVALVENLSHVFVVEQEEKMEEKREKGKNKKKMSVIQGSSEKEEPLFDPTPLIDVFSDALSQLYKLQENVDQKITSLTENCSAEEKIYEQQMAELQIKFSQYGEELKEIDKRMTQVTQVAVQIGDRLASADAKRQATVEAKKLMDYFSELNHKGQSDDPIFSSVEMIHERSILLKKLNRISAECQGIDRVQLAMRTLTNYSRELENELLEKIGSYFVSDEMDMNELKKYIFTLCEFNGGESCVTLFLTEFSKRIENYREKFHQNSKSIEERNYKPIITSFFKSIESILTSEQNLINTVFPNPSQFYSRIVSLLFTNSPTSEGEENLTIYSVCKSPTLFLPQMLILFLKKRSNFFWST